MKINGTDITTYGAQLKQWRISPGMRSLKQESEWVRGSPLPFFHQNFAGFKEFSATLMIYGTSREEIEGKASNVLAALLGQAELELEGRTKKFCGILEKANLKEHSDNSRSRWQTLELEFSGYEHGDYTEEPFSESGGPSSVQVTNPGNMMSPMILELTPTLGAASITMTGICRDSETGEDLPVTIKNLTTGKKIILDGISGLITEDGAQKAADVDIWALPTLKPGINTITFGTDKINAVVKVLPIYM